MIAGRDAVDVLADLLDDPGALVAEHRRQRPGVDALHGVEVGVADAAGGQADEHLPGSWRGELHVLHDERRAGRPQDRGPHAGSTRIDAPDAASARRVTASSPAPGPKRS